MGEHCIRESFFGTLRHYQTLPGGANVQNCPVLKLTLKLCCKHSTVVLMLDVNPIIT